MTHTYAALEVSAASYDEIAAKLREAGYDHAFDPDEGAIDMHGIGLIRAPVSPEVPRDVMEFLRISVIARGDVPEAVRKAAILLCDRHPDTVTETRWVSTTERQPDLDGRLWAVLTERRENGRLTGFVPLYEYYHFDNGWATDATFECAGCGSITTVEGCTQPPPDGLCPPCHFFGPDWEDDPVLMGVLLKTTARNAR